MNPTLVSVIIPVFNGLNYTKKCLDSLSIQVAKLNRHIDYVSVIVTDDGSTDGTFEWIKLNHPKVHLVKGDGNLWWSGGINRGVEYAFKILKSDYILWWNNDILPAQNYMEQLIKIIDTNNPKVIIGSKILTLRQKNIIWGMGGRFDSRKGAKCMYGEQQQDNEKFNEVREVDWFPGMGTCFHKSVFSKIGYLDEKNFPQYHGDSDYTYRAKKAGFKLLAFPQLVIYNDDTNTGLIHQGSISNLYKSLVSIKSNQNIRKDILFYRLHSGTPMAYFSLFKKYFRYIGGFFKWKILNFFGVKKKHIYEP